jgi:DNA polymerase-3 subunit epsilon
MESRNFAIVVLTVVGRKPGTMRIMAISIIRIEEGKVCKQFKSAVNPERDVPDYIMQRTGITAAQLLKSPTFSELAEQVISLLQDVVLVAHNCSFIHYILQSEFRYLGWIYTSPKLSTMQLAKKLIPNLSSYELPYLCRVLGISYGNGYHSEEEAEAISTLFQRLLSLDLEGKIIGNMIRPSFRVPQKLPVHVDSSQIHALPTRPGIYKFQNTNGRVIYVGKAKNIKKRVLSHFYHPSEKERNLCQETYTIDHEVMGSELLAFLREADLIQKHSPDHNFIQKKRHITYYIVPQKNRKGILQL